MEDVVDRVDELVRHNLARHARSHFLTQAIRTNKQQRRKSKAIKINVRRMPCDSTPR